MSVLSFGRTVAIAFAFSHALGWSAQPYVRDSAAKWNFKNSAGMVFQGNRPLVCVQLPSLDWAVWDPNTDSIVRTERAGCEGDSKLRFPKAAPAFTVHPPGGSDASYASASSIVKVLDTSGNCGPAFLITYYDVHFANTVSSFYLVAALREPQERVLAGTCESANGIGKTIKLSFVSPLIESVALDASHTLLTSSDPGLVEPVDLVIDGLPDKNWRSANGAIYLFRKEDLMPVLDAAGADDALRERAFNNFVRGNL